MQLYICEQFRNMKIYISEVLGIHVYKYAGKFEKKCTSKERQSLSYSGLFDH